MTDRELLELAAKAAGWESWDWLEDDALNVYAKDGRHDVFEPLTDDGDALRLVVQLNMTLVTNTRNKEYFVRCGMIERYQAYGDDRQHALRKAIVSVAAEIGRGTK